MKDLKQRLVEGDPVSREPRMSDADVQAMRRMIVVEARRQPAVAPMSWPNPLALAGALAACLVLGISIGMRLSDKGALVNASRPAGPVPQDVRRQLQITSPGGTRIIWTFHQELDL